MTSGLLTGLPLEAINLLFRFFDGIEREVMPSVRIEL
jgi:hypothetical protein